MYTFQNAWNILDLLLTFLTPTVVVFQVVQNSVADSFLQQMANSYNEFLNISLFITWKDVNNVLTSLLVFFITIRMLRILNFSNYFCQYLTALKHISITILSLLPMFLIIFFTFAMVFSLIIGNYLYSYRTFWITSISIFSIMLSMGYSYLVLVNYI